MAVTWSQDAGWVRQEDPDTLFTEGDELVVEALEDWDPYRTQKPNAVSYLRNYADLMQHDQTVMQRVMRPNRSLPRLHWRPQPPLDDEPAPAPAPLEQDQESPAPRLRKPPVRMSVTGPAWRTRICLCRRLRCPTCTERAGLPRGVPTTEQLVGPQHMRLTASSMTSLRSLRSVQTRPVAERDAVARSLDKAGPKQVAARLASIKTLAGPRQDLGDARAGVARELAAIRGQRMLSDSQELMQEKLEVASKLVSSEARGNSKIPRPEPVQKSPWALRSREPWDAGLDRSDKKILSRLSMELPVGVSSLLRVRELFADVDQEHCRVVSIDEFHGMLLHFGGLTREDPESRLHAIWDIADTDGDGYLSLDEFIVWFVCHGVDVLPKPVLLTYLAP